MPAINFSTDTPPGKSEPELFVDAGGAPVGTGPLSELTAEKLVDAIKDVGLEWWRCERS
jgi:hypothetical protein